MQPDEFPYERFLKQQEIQERRLEQFLSSPTLDEVPVMINYSPDVFGAVAGDRVRSLEMQLDALALTMEWDSDFRFSYLEPWHGVGIYASMFGCPVEWNTFDAPQTLPILKTVEELQDLQKPDVMDSEMSHMVLETIRYFRHVTHDQLDICLTDTQSPNDTASLIMDTTEFFTYHRQDPQKLAPLLNMVTDLIIEFSDMQLEVIGPMRTHPGHIMISGKRLPGVSISDDNMSFLSPKAYAACAQSYNSRIGAHFGGVAIHTCGNFTHNFSLIQQVTNLTLVDCAIAGADPQPNDPKMLVKGFAGTGIPLKVRSSPEEYLPLLEDLVDPNLKMILQINTDGNVQANQALYKEAKNRCQEILGRKKKERG